MNRGREDRDELAGAVAGSDRGMGPLGPGQRWTAARKREVVLRLLRGESLDALSRELGVEVYRLEKWREKSLVAIDVGLKKRDGDPLKAELESALRRIGKLTVEKELLEEKIERLESGRPLAYRRSRR